MKRNHHHYKFADKTTPIRTHTDRAGKVYHEMRDGSIRRHSPLKPWHGKSERRQVIKARRADRKADFPA